jgi:hypothetical protein
MSKSNLKPRQGAISQPKVQKALDQLHGGSKAPPIKVDGDVIVDGHHREIAGQIFGQAPQTTPWKKPPSSVPKAWKDVIIDLIDWD